MEAIETFEVDGLTVELHLDLDPSSPREADNLAELVCQHTRYSLGDRELDHGEAEILARRGLQGLYRYLRLVKGALLVQPLYLYDHSILRLSTSSWIGRAQHAEWDSGIAGVGYITEARVQELCGDGEQFRTPEFLAKALNDEVKEYDSFMAGDVYGYVVLRDGEEIDSCWGFIGLEYAREEAVGSAKAEARREREEVRKIELCMAL